MSVKGSFSKKTLLAINDMERLGVNPIEMLKQVFDESFRAYKDERGYSNKGDAGAGYLAVAGKAASDLASYKHPKLSAMAIADLTDANSSDRVLTTEQAIAIIKSDPFAPESIQGLDTSRVVESMASTIENPALPIGDANNE